MNKTKSFLVVDDDQTFCDILTRSLNRQGFNTIGVNNSQQAITEASKQRINFAIVDLKIGNESGLHLIPELLQTNSNMAIIVLTGYSSIATAVEAVKLGAMNYLCKPCDTQAILDAFKSTQPNSGTPIEQPPLSVDRLEWEYIQQALIKHEGNISATARTLCMHRRTLQRKLQKKPVKR